MEHYLNVIGIAGIAVIATTINVITAVLLATSISETLRS